MREIKMNIKHRFKYLLLCSTMVATQIFAHGWQTFPNSRINYLVQSGQSEVLKYNPAQFANNLAGTLGNTTLEQMTNYSSSAGTGPLAFFKDHYADLYSKPPIVMQPHQLCGFADNLRFGDTSPNAAYFPKVNESMPEIQITTVSMDKPVDFTWHYTARHVPSNQFVFMTQYPAGQYKPNPSFDELHFVCAVPVTEGSGDNWQCSLPVFHGDAKQVMVTIWQRVDPAGENFISCADVNVENTATVPVETWSPIGDKPWTSTLKPEAGELVTFDLYSQPKAHKGSLSNNTVVRTYSLAVNDNNLARWDSLLAARINGDNTSDPQLLKVGVLNSGTGQIMYDTQNPANNEVYLNTQTADTQMEYSYRLTTKEDPNPVIFEWRQVGLPLNHWVNRRNAIRGENLSFAVIVNGVEQRAPTVMVGRPSDAERLVASVVNHADTFPELNLKVGVLKGTGNLAYVEFVKGSDNKAYVHRANDDVRDISYVVRNLSQAPTYPVYPEGMGTYKAGDLVQNEAGQVYICLEAGWCNSTAYGLESTAWKAITPRPAPDGYSTYPAGKPYTSGSVVASIEGHLYECKQAGWCNDDSGTYAPGIGRAWSAAWDSK
jgi:predicted carbohydrate-binding protein with CBM5 and CBM33 domain